ncbi:MAG: hypothetical protein M3R50_05165 [Bacteroidota bacterium]|nr:hypothetical protein [Bacteroidota bacterium]
MNEVDFYYENDFNGLLFKVFKINDEEYLHYFVDLDIHFISELPFKGTFFLERRRILAVKRIKGF